MKRVLITSEIAAQMLAKNVGNRDVRPSVVKLYAQQMREGQWRETHQAIAVNASGNLIDGQHRLMAIVESGASIWFWVATYDDSSNALSLPIDLQARRSHSDILQINRNSVQVVSTILRHVSNNGRGVAVASVQKAYSAIVSDVESVAHEGNNKTQRAAATIRAGVVMRLVELRLRGRDDERLETIQQFRRFVAVDALETWWVSVQSFFKQMSSSNYGSMKQNERFIRAWVAFNPDKRNATLRLSPENECMSDIRATATAAGML